MEPSGSGIKVNPEKRAASIQFIANNPSTLSFKKRVTMLIKARDLKNRTLMAIVGFAIGFSLSIPTLSCQADTAAEKRVEAN